MEIRKQRNSSIELFRILATFLVLIVHWNGWFVGGMPEKACWSLLDLQMGGQILIRSFSVCCVNCFLLLSGYFGIKLKWKSLVNLYVTLFSIFIPFYIVDSIWLHSFSIRKLLSWCACFTQAGYFIQNYALLMFFAPLLNAFVEKTGRNNLKWVLAFCLIEFWFECVQHVETLGFKQGYSFLHFVLMYMIGRCVFLYIGELHMLRISWWIYGYLLCVVAESFMYLFGIGRDWEYCSPLVIFSTICLFLPFTYYSFSNKCINSIAISTLSVYVMQCFNPMYRILTALDTKMLHSLPYFHYLLLSVLVWVVFFMSCIAYDKIRLMVTAPMLRYIYKKLNI